MTFSLDDVCVKLLMWLWNQRFSLIRDMNLGFLLDDRAGITVVVQVIQEWLQVPGIESTVECSFKLILRWVSDKVCAVV